MSDNVTLPATGALVATDDVSGVQFQKVKLDVGADGVSAPVTSSNPLPVVDTTAHTDLAAILAKQPATPALESGNLAAILAQLVLVLAKLPTGPALDATVAATNTALAAVLAKQPAAPALASGQPAINGDGGALAHVTNFPTTQAVSGTVTANTGLSQPATDAQMRATPIPVSGTVTVSNPGAAGLTDTQLRASAVPVSGTFYQTTQPVSAASLPLPTGAALEAGGNLAAILAKIIAAPATAANQATEITSLASIDTKTPALIGGAVPVSGTAAVGSAPVNPPLSIAGVDAAGNKQHLLVIGGRTSVREDGIQGSIPITVGAAAVATGRQFKILATVAGNVSVTFADGTTDIATVAVGMTILQWAITGVNTSGTTATATYSNLK